jgi:cytochrome P450
MIHHALRLQEDWQPGQTRDMHLQMMHLALSISGQTLLGSDVDSTLVGEVDRAFRAVMHYVRLKRFLLGSALVKLPLPAVRHFHEAMERLDAIFHRVIAEHRAGGKGQDDLMAILLAAADEQGRMNDKQVRDEVATLFIAGYETSANALTWTWYLLSQNPVAEARLHAELEAVLAGRPPRPEDVPALVYIEKVFREALRLYPPPWAISRRALAAHSVGGYDLPANSVYVMSPYVVQRDGRFYPAPERFDPDRWTPEFRASLHPYAFIPFGGGSRKCIGESFAWTEATLAIAAIAQHWRFRLAPDQKVVARPVLQIRPKYGMRMILERRG